SLVDNGETAINEIAEASGLNKIEIKDRNPLKATSYGTGELIKQALDLGVKKIILCVGGSATVDGGCGILSALGVQFKDSKKKVLRPIPRELINLNEIDTANLDSRLQDVDLDIMCDVQNELLGSSGAAAVFGPQKGATSDGVDFLENFLRQLSLKIL